MDGEDMASWLLKIIDVGEPENIYHIGSERSISIRELAVLVGARYESLTRDPVTVTVLGESSPLDGVSRYVPSTAWTRQILNVEETISLESSVDKMILAAIANSKTNFR